AVLQQDLPTLLLACPAHPHDKRDLHHQVVARSDDTLRDLVPARDPTEDVDQDAFDFGVHQDHGQRVLDDLGLGPPTDVAEVRRLTASALYEVERAHTQARAVADDPDVSVEGDVGEVALFRFDLVRVTLEHGAVAFFEFLVPPGRVVVDLQLRVAGDHVAVAGYHQRVDLGDQRVVVGYGAGELFDQRRQRPGKLAQARVVDELRKLE